MRKMAIHARIGRSQEQSNLLYADLRRNVNHRRRGNARVLPLAEHTPVHVLQENEVLKLQECALVLSAV
jgi:hypothetical protein